MAHPGQEAPDHAAAVLEAAAAVATAAVATAAELDVMQTAGTRAGADETVTSDETVTFDQEADAWPVQAQENDRAELGIASEAAGPGTAATGPGVVTLEADLSEIQTVKEMDEDLADLGVMDDD